MEPEQGGPIVELLQEAVGQLGPPTEEVLLQGGGLVLKGPQQLVRAEEGVVAEQAAQGMLGHHGSAGCRI